MHHTKVAGNWLDSSGNSIWSLTESKWKRFLCKANCGKSLRQVLAPWLTSDICRVSNQDIKAVKAASQMLVNVLSFSLRRLECLKLKSYPHLRRLELDHLKSFPPTIPLGTQSNCQGVVCPESVTFSFILHDSVVFCVQYVNIHWSKAAHLGLLLLSWEV